MSSTRQHSAAGDNWDSGMDKPARGWRPEVGDKLRGTVVDIDTATSNFGNHEDYPLLTIETEDGEMVAVHGFHHVLKGELAKRRPEVGDQIAIRYHGVPEGKPYELYTVRVKKDRPAAPAVNWDQMAADAEDESFDDDGESY